MRQSRKAGLRRLRANLTELFLSRLDKVVALTLKQRGGILRGERN
jgi:hypothetical protein